MRKKRLIVFIVLCGTITWIGCIEKSRLKNDTPPPLFPSPLIVPLNTDTGYRVNLVTGDSIKPVKNSKGEVIKTGIPIPVQWREIDSVKITPKIIPASWTTVGDAAPNEHAVPDKLTVIPVDESKLQQFIPGKDTSSFVLLDEKGDTIPTGVPIPAVGKVVPCGQPQLEEALPMSLNNSSRYNIRFLDTYHGLKDLNINSVLEDRRGNLWIASNEGLTCFNGKTLLNFTKKEGLMFSLVRYILEDRNGNLWIDYGNGNRSLYDGKNFTHFTIRVNGLMLGNNSIVEDNKGNIWFKDAMSGITRYDGNYFTHFTEREGLNAPLILSMLPDSKGNLWFGTRDNGVCRFNGKSFTYFTDKDGLNSNSVGSIIEDKKGNIWFGTDRGIACYNGKNFTQFTTKEGLNDNVVNTMLEDKKGDLWIGTIQNGVTRFDGKTFIHITEQEGLTSNFVSGMSMNKDGNIWIATNKGISYFDNGSITRLSGISNHLHTGMDVIMENKQGHLLLGSTLYGLLKYDGNVVTRLLNQNSIKSTIALLEDQKKNLWIGTIGRGLFCFDGSQLKQFTIEEGLRDNNIWALIQDRKGNIRIGTSGALTMYDGKRFTHFTEKEGLSNEPISSLVEDHNGNIWIGTFGGGITRYDGKSFTQYTEREGLYRNFVRSIMIDKQGNLWIGTWGGISVFNGKNFIQITEKQGLPIDIVISIIQDDKENVWAVTGQGISKIPAGYINNQQTSTLKQPGIINYNEKDGLRSSYMDATIDKQNRLWLTEADFYGAELNVLDLNFFNKPESPPSVNLNNVSINDKFFDYRNPGEKELKKIKFSNVPPFYNIPQNLELPYYSSQIAFYFTATGQLTSERIKYSYKLDGLGNDWSNPSTENKARYQYLPPGTYTFKVRAMDRSQIWGEPFEYRFTIVAPFWQRWWFWSLIGLFVVCIVVWLLQKRINSIRKRENEKTESVKRMAELELQSLRAQLNPHFMFNSLNAIQELILLEENEKSQSYLARFSKLLRMLLENAERPFIPLQREIEFLHLYLSLENLRIPDLQHSITVDPSINTEQTMIPNMILQPYIENAIWHGLSHKQIDRKLQLRITKTNGIVQYEIEDNGVGRKRSSELKSLYRKEHKSKGMELLSKRFKLLSKEYGSDIETSVTDVMNNGEVTGTLVTIKVPSKFSETNKNQTS